MGPKGEGTYPHSIDWGTSAKGWGNLFPRWHVCMPSWLVGAISLGVWLEASVPLHVYFFTWPGLSDSMVAEFQGSMSQKEGRNYIAFDALVSKFPWHHFRHTQFMETVTRTCPRWRRGHIDLYLLKKTMSENCRHVENHYHKKYIYSILSWYA